MSAPITLDLMKLREGQSASSVRGKRVHHICILLRLIACVWLFCCGSPARVEAYVFITDPFAVWPDGNIPMDLYLAGGSGLIDGSTSWKAVANNALAIWNSYLGTVKFTVYTTSPKVPGSGDSKNQVFFSTNVYGKAFGPDVLATTLRWNRGTTCTESDTIFNSSRPWNSYGGDLKTTASGEWLCDFKRVAIHEFGHTLGLDHPDEHGQSVVALMNHQMSNIETLTADDVAGISALYPAPPPPPPPPPPSISMQPQSQTVTAGQNVTFTVSASGSPSPSYQWYWNNILLPGANSPFLSFANVQPSDAGAVYVFVSNSHGSVRSQTAWLTVTPAATAPSITSQPASQTVFQGKSVTFTVAASGSQPLSYQWYRNNSAIAGATTASFTISVVQTSDAGEYKVRVVNSGGSIDSAIVVLTIQIASNNYTDDFESGKFDKMPWTFGGNAPWQVVSNDASSGRFAARSGVIRDNQRSSLTMTTNTLAGTGSFDLRVSSEPPWDNLEFYLNGQLLSKWSGEVSWRNYQFQLVSGRNTLEWRYQKDPGFSEDEDAAYIDNLYLPMVPATNQPALLSIARSTNNQVRITMTGQASRAYVVQTSVNLKAWTSVVTNSSETGLSQWLKTVTNSPRLFYRALGQ